MAMTLNVIAEGILKVKGSHLRCKRCSVSETVQDRDVVSYYRSLTGIFMIILSGLRWRGSATGRVLDLRSAGRRFKSHSRQRCVTTLGKLFTPMCLCHQAV